MASPDFQFRLRGKPNGSLIVKIGAYGCDSTLTLQNPFFYPHMFEFNQHSSDLSGKFKISAPMIGCFFVKIYTDSKSYAVYDEDIIMLNVKSVNSPPDPARLFSASFANDGLSILLKFNAETEMEKELIELSFPCLNLFHVPALNTSSAASSGGTDLHCSWKTDATTVVMRGASIASNCSKRSSVCHSSCEHCLCKQALLTYVLRQITQLLMNQWR